MRKLSSGFTLIELLIVIAVLGILAVAVLSAINPIEQINRGKDTGSRSDAEQLIGAMDRFYTNVGYYAWKTGTTGTDVLGWTKVNGSWSDGTTAVLTKLSAGVVGVSTGELKSSFTNRVSIAPNPLWVYNKGGQGDSTYVCFKPLSAAMATEATTRCGATKPSDYPASACINTTDCGTAGNCVCLP